MTDTHIMNGNTSYLQAYLGMIWISKHTNTCTNGNILVYKIGIWVFYVVILWKEKVALNTTEIDKNFINKFYTSEKTVAPNHIK